MTYVGAVLLYLLGIQIRFADFALLRGRNNYRIQLPQIISYISLVLCICLWLKELIKVDSIFQTLLACCMCVVLAFIIEFVLSKLNSKRLLINLLIRLVIVTIVADVVSKHCLCMTFPCILMGIFITNNPFSVVHGKVLRIASYLSRTPLTGSHEERVVIDTSNLPVFANVGRQVCTEDIQKIYNVADYGIEPNVKTDSTLLLNELIENVGRQGGGCVFFPKGRYYFNCTKGQRNFIQINHSNITLKGETDQNGKLLSELVCCGKLVDGKKNPWLSPFLITTGEQLQPSNWFWGLQFRKKKNIITKSNSSSDPGSDGAILTPEFATTIISDSKAGEDLLHVADSNKVGKYILLGLYNTDVEGNLIKDILGLKIRPEWKTALRAGEEEAPSYQWLVEVDSIVDEHTIKLTQPLWRDCLMEYEPTIFNVEMLENICIQHLKINSLWNGLFLHHGFRPYYSVQQAQEMDYGWNAINMKRVAHGLICNVEICNFTNPLYIMDSRNTTVESVMFRGYDGHQGIKLYEHACDNLIRNITFLCHYADMMGGEGNAYGNVFSQVSYLNPEFKPCEYDFHGFSEGPMSPPAYNLFDNVKGFRYIKMAGADFNQPACAQWNIWWNCVSEGEKKGDSIFHSIHYYDNISVSKRIGIALRSLLKIHPQKVIVEYNRRINNIKNNCMLKEEHSMLFKNAWIFGMNTTFMEQNNDYVHFVGINKKCIPDSLLNN